MKINVVNCTGLIKDLICFYSQSGASAGADAGRILAWRRTDLDLRRVIIFIADISKILNLVDR